MLTIEEFDSLEVGDHVETEPLFRALTSDPVTLRTEKIEQQGQKTRIEFVVTFVGITLGRWTCTKLGGALTWSTP